jgi:hypothetical protein
MALNEKNPLKFTQKKLTRKSSFSLRFLVLYNFSYRKKELWKLLVKIFTKNYLLYMHNQCGLCYVEMTELVILFHMANVCFLCNFTV